jgi:arsenate reductase-like glutaredoxin family protein
VDFKDILKEPPPRAFLEKHVDAGRLPEFLSKRSPIFKDRAMPSSKREAIELMLEQPNLIRRPVLVAGSHVLFGFDKDEYRKALT